VQRDTTFTQGYNACGTAAGCADELDRRMTRTGKPYYWASFRTEFDTDNYT
jgi:hypothetical protein